jgi:hypothetical protein
MRRRRSLKLSERLELADFVTDQNFIGEGITAFPTRAGLEAIRAVRLETEALSFFESVLSRSRGTAAMINTTPFATAEIGCRSHESSFLHHRRHGRRSSPIRSVEVFAGR